jgi:hypothetical protein
LRKYGDKKKKLKNVLGDKKQGKSEKMECGVINGITYKLL